jgi:hypothetical protein
MPFYNNFNDLPVQYKKPYNLKRDKLSPEQSCVSWSRRIILIGIFID